MELKNFSIISQYDGLSLGVTVAEAKETLGVVLLSHGMAEHRKRYIPFMEFLAQNGYTCIINDHRGHGESVANKEDLGYFTSQGLLADMKQINDLAKETYPDKPIFLFGHSMGSLAVRAYTRLYDNTVNGLIVCGSPSENAAAKIAIGLCNIISKFKGDRHRSKLIYNLSLGSYQKKFKSEGERGWLSPVKDVQLSYQKDELCGFPFTLKGYVALFNLMVQTYSKKPHTINNKLLPVHFISGENDPCLVNHKSFFKAVASFKRFYPNTTFKLYLNERHEILNGNKQREVFEDILNTLNNFLRIR